VIHPSDAIYITHESHVNYGLIYQKKKIVSEIVNNNDIIVEFCRDNTPFCISNAENVSQLSFNSGTEMNGLDRLLCASSFRKGVNDKWCNKKEAEQKNNGNPKVNDNLSRTESRTESMTDIMNDILSRTDIMNDILSRTDIMNDILHAFCIGIAEITKTNDSNESPKKNQLQSIILVPTKENIEHIRRLFFTLQKNLSVKTIMTIDDILYGNPADDPHIIISTTAFMYRVLSNQYVNMDHIRFILLMDNENIMKKMQEMVYYIPSTVKYGIITNCPDVEIPSIIFQKKKNHVRIKVS
jgi:hypothetical protein